VRAATFIQARMGSSRLPGKVLASLAEKPVLLRIVDRVRQSHLSAQAVVLTSDSPADDPLAQLCRDAGVDVVRGSEHDVLARFGSALKAFPTEIVVRITADCPLSDPALIDAAIETLTQRPELHYVATATGARPAEAGLRRFPDGLDLEAFSAGALREAVTAAQDPYEREHVTPYIRRHPERFPAMVLEAEEDLGEERWTLDYAADLELIEAIYARLPDEPAADPFAYRTVLALLEKQPQLRALNERHRVHQ
jgi:spore coat polysaccharide biosynthesis protein SpsF